MSVVEPGVEQLVPPLASPVGRVLEGVGLATAGLAVLVGVWMVVYQTLWSTTPAQTLLVVAGVAGAVAGALFGAVVAAAGRLVRMADLSESHLRYIAAQLRASAHTARATASVVNGASEAPGVSFDVGQLEALVALRVSSELSDVEFAAAKSRMLGIQ